MSCAAWLDGNRSPGWEKFSVFKAFIEAILILAAATFVAATSEARGGRAPHKVPKEHRHKTNGRCMDHEVWIRGCK